VAISFMVKREPTTKDRRLARVFYARRPELETADEKLSFLASHTMRVLDFDEVSPDKNANWVNLTNNDFETLLPLASKETKAAKTAGQERAIFKNFSLGTSTNRDEWVIDFDTQAIEKRMRWFCEEFEQAAKLATYPDQLKWSRNLKRRMGQGRKEPFAESCIRETLYRPFVKQRLYDSSLFVDERGETSAFFPQPSTRNPGLCVIAGDRQAFALVASEVLPNLNLYSADATKYACLHVFDANGNRTDNITDWALKQFTAHYADETGPRKTARKLTKPAIFHYCYAVLHDPLYREKYAQNLKREFPRIPFYADFWRWADWGEQLMALHIGYESAPPFALTRTDEPDTRARAAGQQPKALLRSDPAAGSITLDSETTLRGVPPEAWAYKLGNRSAIDWVLDQHKEKKPKDPTIREKFDTYRFADHKEKVVDLLMRVTTVSVETVRITEAMKGVAR
jgi:predicted helicase